jgi:hypothetical protein
VDSTVKSSLNSLSCIKRYFHYCAVVTQAVFREVLFEETIITLISYGIISFGKMWVSRRNI